VQFPEEYSWPTYDHVVRHILATLNPQTILDVGAGAGKYGRMAREVTPQADVTAMEIGKDSIERHSLGQIYDRVLELGPSEIIRQQPEAQWDLAILGDVLEHFPKSEGQDFLNWLDYHARFIVIVVPEALCIHRANWYEGHNSVWTWRDFYWHDNWAYHTIEQAQLFVLRGYLKSADTLARLCDSVNNARHQVRQGSSEEVLTLNHQDGRKVLQRPGPVPGTVTRVWWREP
jgi:hypothetical protein